MKIVAIDIENDVPVEGWFPKAERNAIIGVSLSLKEAGSWDKKPLILMAKTHDDDKAILEKMLKFIEKHDPDIVTGFNCREFDLPYIVDRLRANGLDPNRLARGQLVEQHNTREVGGKVKLFRDIMLGERVVFDTYTHWAAQDDKLFGLPNRQLKTLAQHFAPDQTWIMGDALYPKMRELVNTPTLRQYMVSDIRATQLMFDIYYPVFDNIVKLLGNVTLKEITENTKGFLGMHTCRTCCQRAGIEYEGTNTDRWGQRAISKQAAIPDTFIPNQVFRHPIHLDFSAMYPSIVMAWNISPETTRIIGFEPLGDFSAKRDLSTGALEIRIPDEKLHENVVIRISQEEGELPKLYKALSARRVNIKAEMKKHKRGTPRYMELDSEQSAVKMIMNSGTGYMGELHAKYADLAQYIAIVGLGRELFKALIGFIEHRQYKDLLAEYNKANPNKENKSFDPARSPFRYVIQGDTDGIYLNRPVDMDVVNRFLSTCVGGWMRGNPDYMKLGIDQYEAIFCPNYKGKNYALVRDGKILFKGVAFKSSRWPSMFKGALRALGRVKLLGDGEPRQIYKEWRENIVDRKLPFGDYVMHMEVQDPDSYPNNCQAKQLGLQARERFKMDLHNGQSFSYVRLKTGDWIVTALDDHTTLPGSLDMDYYVNILNGAVERLGMENDVLRTKQSNLFELTGMSV